jgi:hypothetical protein
MENNELLERLGELVDTAENFLAWNDNPFAHMPMKIEAFTTGLEKLRDEIKTIYLELGGEDY